MPEGASAPGLEEVKERLKLDRMTKDELNAYYRHLDNIVILRDNIFTERAEGRAEERLNIARSMKAKSLPTDLIAEVTGLSLSEINSLS